MMATLIGGALRELQARHERHLESVAKVCEYVGKGRPRDRCGRRMRIDAIALFCWRCRSARQAAAEEYGSALVARLAELEQALREIAAAGNLTRARKLARRALGERP